MPTHDRKPAPDLQGLGRARPRHRDHVRCEINWPDGSKSTAMYLQDDPKSHRHAIVEREDYSPDESISDFTIRVPIAWLRFSQGLNDRDLPENPHPFGGKP